MEEDIEIDFNKSSLEDFIEFLPKTEPKKFNITNVWHEMGHLVGLLIAKKN